MYTREYLVEYLDSFVVPFRRPNTVACYRRAWAALPDRLLDTPIDQLNGLAIQRAINAQAAAYPRAGQLTYTCLHAALRKAVQLGILDRSPMDGVLKPLHQPRKAAILTPDELARYLVAAKDSRCYPLLLLIASLGLRRGEALGLLWEHIDFAGGQVAVVQQRINGRIAPLKSKASRRVLPMPPMVAQVLAPLRGFGLVLDVSAHALAIAHADACGRAGVPSVHLHGLRHSMATAQAALGCPMKLLQGMLGHSKYQLTADLYADHITSEAYRPYLAEYAARIVG